jgi:hypothetical protein
VYIVHFYRVFDFYLEFPHLQCDGCRWRSRTRLPFRSTWCNLRFFVEVHIVSASVFVSSHACAFFFLLCSIVFVYPSFLSFLCVLSRFCLVFRFCRFLNNPFTLVLRCSVADIFYVMVQVKINWNMTYRLWDFVHKTLLTEGQTDRLPVPLLWCEVILSSPDQRPCELLPSLGVRRTS